MVACLGLLHSRVHRDSVYEQRDEPHLGRRGIAMTDIAKVPVTVLTGFLGSGKTTLLNRILTEQHGHKYAVIVHEFGQIGIDNDLVLNADEDVIEMNNGCICCTVCGDLIRILGNIIQRDEHLDGIFIETTGLADPGPVIQGFFVDENVAKRVKLDAVVTVADAFHLEKQLEAQKEVNEQIAFADILLLNKTELVEASDIERVEARIRKINPYTKIIHTAHCDVPLTQVVGLDAFSVERVLEIEPDLLNIFHRHHHHHGHHEHLHDEIKSVSLMSDVQLDMDKFQRWFYEMPHVYGDDILRSKGIFDFKNQDERYVIQAVHTFVRGSAMGPWPEDKPRQSRLVFIGRYLEKMGLEAGFEACKV